jgi:uncharacterized protein YbjT (DUF2867 family)
MTQKLTVVVTGATGKQGGAVARGLLKQGHKVRAVTRDPNSSLAKSLAHAGATSLFAMTIPSGGTDAAAGHRALGGSRFALFLRQVD